MNNIVLSEGELTPEGFLSLREACGLERLEPELTENALRRSLIVLSAHSGGKTVGMARVVGDGAFVFLLCDLMVHPLWRRQGIGSMLVREACCRSALSFPENHWVTMGLFAAEGREDFYERLGFMRLPLNGLGAGMQKIYRSDEM